jgi:hypothetical protein
MACRERHELVVPAEEERVVGDQKRANVQLGEGCETGVDLDFRSGLQDQELRSVCARRFLDVFHNALSIRIAGVHEQGDYFGLGNQLRKQLEPLGIELGSEDADAREVSARSGKTGD